MCNIIRLKCEVGGEIISLNAKSVNIQEYGPLAASPCDSFFGVLYNRPSNKSSLVCWSWLYNKDVNMYCVLQQKQCIFHFYIQCIHTQLQVLKTNSFTRVDGSAINISEPGFYI